MSGEDERPDRQDQGLRAQNDRVHEGNRIDHVGIYMGNDSFLHSPRTGRDVTVSRMDSGYWANRFRQARRIALD